MSSATKPELVAIDAEDTSETVESEFQESRAVNGSQVQIKSPRSCSSEKNKLDFSNQEATGGEKIDIAIGPQHFDLLKLIGEGAFGKVIMVRSRLDGKFYAMKVISKKLLKKKNNVQYMKSERDILTKVEHPFIVSLWFAFQTEKKLFLVMDFLAGGELFFHLKRRGLILEHEARFYFAEMILAIEFLHNKGIIHRDLKPENVLLRADGHVCLTDFGLAKEIGDNERARTLCGTSEYMAPEMLTRNGYGKGVDWWSLGALFFEMLAAKPPFTSKNQKELDKKILTEKIVCPSYLTANAVSLLRGMLEKDVTKRLGASKSTMFNIGGVAALKQHAFFVGLDWVALVNLAVPPPIDLGLNPDMFNGNGTIDPTGGANSGPGSPGPGALDPTSLLTRHFHEGFTTQQVSLSVMESSPRAFDTDTASERDPMESDNDEGLYRDFDYVDRDFTCTAEQVKQFESELEQKLAKAAKKKKMKAKKDEERLERQKEEERLQKIREEEERVRKELEAMKMEAERQRKEEEAKRAAAIRERQRQRELRAEMQRALNAHKEDVEKVEKKLKALRKKLRDINDLESKIAGGLKPSAEQREKLSKKQSVEDDIMEMEEEADNLIDSPPPPIPQELLDIPDNDDDYDNVTKETKESVGERLTNADNGKDEKQGEMDEKGDDQYGNRSKPTLQDAVIATTSTQKSPAPPANVNSERLPAAATTVRSIDNSVEVSCDPSTNSPNESNKSISASSEWAVQSSTKSAKELKKDPVSTSVKDLAPKNGSAKASTPISSGSKPTKPAASTTTAPRPALNSSGRTSQTTSALSPATLPPQTPPTSVAASPVVPAPTSQPVSAAPPGSWAARIAQGPSAAPRGPAAAAVLNPNTTAAPCKPVNAPAPASAQPTVPETPAASAPWRPSPGGWVARAAVTSVKGGEAESAARTSSEKAKSSDTEAISTQAASAEASFASQSTTPSAESVEPFPRDEPATIVEKPANNIANTSTTEVEGKVKPATGSSWASIAARKKS